MRIIAVLVLGAVMYFGVPYIWARAMMHQVNKVSSDPSNFPEMNAMVSGIPQSTFENGAALANAINPTVTINTEEYEAIGVRSRADDAMRQSQHAQDMAYDATH